MQIIVMILAIIGVIFNIAKRPESYIIWTFTNAYWVWHNYSIGEYEQAYLFLAMLAASIYGAVKWYKDSRKGAKTQSKKTIPDVCKSCFYKSVYWEE